jgi:acyl-coenzyme A synthetase/AMP-(fatty) acid ligase
MTPFACLQVPPAELEALLLAHPSIADAAVVS